MPNQRNECGILLTAFIWTAAARRRFYAATEVNFFFFCETVGLTEKRRQAAALQIIRVHPRLILFPNSQRLRNLLVKRFEYKVRSRLRLVVMPHDRHVDFRAMKDGRSPKSCVSPTNIAGNVSPLDAHRVWTTRRVFIRRRHCQHYLQR